MRIKRAAVCWVSILTLAAAGCAAQSSEEAGPPVGTSEPQLVSVQRDVPASEWCGDEPLKVGVSDGFGGNAWRRIALEIVELEAAKCSAVDEEVLYTNANGDPQKASSDVASLVSQGVDVLLVHPDFGAAQLPSMRAAVKAGVTVVAFDADPGGQLGRDYDSMIVMAAERGGESLGDWMGETIKKGNIVFLGGNAGAPTSLGIVEGIKTALDKHPDVKLLVDEPVTTNWNKVDTQRAVNGLLAKYDQIDGIITDYGVTAVGAIDALVAAGRPVPPIATIATSNELGCLWQDLEKEGKEFPIYSLDSTTDKPQLALRMGVSLANGMSEPRVEHFEMPPFMDSLGGKTPPCEPTLPPDADLSSSLTEQQLIDLF